MNYRSSDTDYVAMVSITQNFQANTLGQPVEHTSVHWFIMFDNNIRIWIENSLIEIIQNITIICVYKEVQE